MNLPMPPHKQGKVRDIYDLGEHLLLVASDRISAFDVVMNEQVPDKGKVLTMLSIFWFEFFKYDIENHIVSTYPPVMSWLHPDLKGCESQLAQRSMLVKKAEVVPVECIVRGYLTGSGWNSYQKEGSICGIQLPEGLKLSQRLPEPIFTPTTKAEIGHDENITFEAVRQTVGDDLANQLKDTSIRLYKKAHDYAISRGIIVADTKFEFGIVDGRLILIDEVLTPDSSRFWFLEAYQEGIPQESYDKQVLRDYLLTLDWDKAPPAPKVPEEIIQKTAERYKTIARLLMGQASA